jgi:hypothetical protein
VKKIKNGLICIENSGKLINVNTEFDNYKIGKWLFKQINLYNSCEQFFIRESMLKSLKSWGNMLLDESELNLNEDVEDIMNKYYKKYE